VFGQQNQQDQQNWQGNAAVARSGEFASPGLFAASNAFPENTTILVENSDNGQSVQVTVVQRIQGGGNIFLLLSEEAGKQIGLTGSKVIRVKASVVATLDTELSESLRDEAFSADPDLNPAVSVAEEQLQAEPEEPAEVEEPAVSEITEEQPPTEAEVAAEPAEQPEEQPPAVITTAEESEAAEEEAPSETAVTEVTMVEEPTVPESTPTQTPEEKRLQEVADRIPQKQLYMPPRQQEVYALAPEPPAEQLPAQTQPEPVVEETPAEVVELEEEAPEEELPVEEPVEVAEQVPPEEEGPPEEQPPRVSMSSPQAEEEPLEVALPGPETTEPEKPSPEGTRLPVPEEESPLTMAPEEPPTAEIEETAEEEEPVIEVEAVAEVAAAEIPAPESTAEARTVLSESLPSRTYFLQLGAYSTRNLAEKLAGDLDQTYSVTILPASSGDKRFFKVLVGPLNVDESGTLLYQFRSRGFKDAFIQYVE
jgi:rare lipoprotein A (peptidoglycan hydrolase)